jgi:hypothetical protein
MKTSITLPFGLVNPEIQLGSSIFKFSMLGILIDNTSGKANINLAGRPKLILALILNIS